MDSPLLTRLHCRSAIGMLNLALRWRQWTAAVYPRLRVASLVFFAGVVAAAIASEYDTVAENAADVAGAVYSSFMLFTGGAIAWAMRFRNA